MRPGVCGEESRGQRAGGLGARGEEGLEGMSRGRRAGGRRVGERLRFVITGIGSAGSGESWKEN